MLSFCYFSSSIFQILSSNVWRSLIPFRCCSLVIFLRDFSSSLNLCICWSQSKSALSSLSLRAFAIFCSSFLIVFSSKVFLCIISFSFLCYIFSTVYLISSFLSHISLSFHFKSSKKACRFYSSCLIYASTHFHIFSSCLAICSFHFLSFDSLSFNAFILTFSSCLNFSSSHYLI